MKRFSTFLAGGLVLTAFMLACSNELENPEVDITKVRCSISPIDVEEDFATGFLDTLNASKATFSGANFLWSEGDRIGIVPNKGSQIYFAVTDGAGTSTASFDGGDWAMKSTGTFYAYYPLYPDIFLSKDRVSVSFAGQAQTGNNNNLHAGDFWTLYSGATTAVGNTLTFAFNHLTSFFKTYVTVPAGTYTKITFSAPSEIFIEDGYFDVSTETPVIVGTTMTNELSLDLQDVTFEDETELTGFLVVAPVAIAGIPITVTVYKEGEPVYEYTLIKANDMAAAKTYAFRATALTPVVSSVAEANALFADGATSVAISEPMTDDETIVLPDTSEPVTISFPTTESESTLTVTYPSNAGSYPSTLSITGPESADLDIHTPNSTVTVNGVSYNLITSRTAANTCIIAENVTVNTLKVIQGGVQVYGTVATIDLSEDEDDAIIEVFGTVSTLLGEDDEEYLPATGVSLNKTLLNLVAGGSQTLTATVSPASAYPKIVWSSSDEAVATVSAEGVVTAIAEGSATITAKTISGGFTASCNVVVASASDAGAVDLDLSVMWASSNLCESGLCANPEDYGDYYAWGETAPKDNYSWENYEWCNGSDNTLTKYNTIDTYGTVDNKMLLDPEDDAAHVKLGGNWRMPTEAECTELRENCTWTWVTNYNGTGINGRLVTSNTNGNSIFLPAAGRRGDTDLYNVGSGGYYWSSSLKTDNPANAWSVLFFSDDVSRYYRYRYFGLSVRPVLSPIAESITLNKSSLLLSVGDSEQLTVTVTPDNVSDETVFWTTSDSSVATVIDGLVTAVNVGTATITAWSGGISATCTVTVSGSVNNGENENIGFEDWDK